MTGIGPMGIGLNDMSDEMLIERIAEGDRMAYRSLSLRHGRRALGLAYRILGNWTESEDAVQEALLKVWTNAERWDAARGQFKSWFDRIVVNQCIDRKRKPVTDQLDETYDAPDPSTTPHQNAEGNEMARAIKTAIDALPERQRAALALCYYDELGCAEAAEILGLTVSATEALLVRARRKIRVALTEMGLIQAGDLR